ncbi:MAG TPA: PDDEXK nuclease domain-containing protein [Puia sp.]|jgi:predicted nuclease of restriction endonuclease-like (RecB) superfamily|nr:PDDEXK nuclease domain-containing protein [Puia sp.]
MKSILSPKYQALVQDLKEKIRRARIRAISAVNKEMLLIYWEIGKVISELEQEEGWGAGIVDKMAQDLKIEFPDFKGMSPRSLRYMREFYISYPLLSPPATRSKSLQQRAAKPSTPKGGESYRILQPPAAKLTVQELLQQVVNQIPWTYHQVLLDKVKDNEERLFYMQKAILNGWSRNILALQIDNRLHEREGKSITNFNERLPEPQSDLANATLKSPYVFDFLSFEDEIQERELEKALIHHLEKFMLELGRGFSFVGSQYRINIDGNEYFPDLVFYNFLLQCFVIFELKVGEFKPEFAGKLNFYVTAFDNRIKNEKHNRTIGVLLCKTPSETVIRFSLEKIDSPIGVSDYNLAKSIPKELKSGMPTIKELEHELIQEIERLKGPAEKRWDNLKKKLATLNKGEIKKTANQEILNALFDGSLKPLLDGLAERLKEFGPEFISSTYGWSANNTGNPSLGGLEAGWKQGSILKDSREIQFWYRLNGLKRAGVEGTDVYVTLVYTMDQYWYGFKMFNYNNQQPFIKKLYDEQLTAQDISQIIDLVCEQIMDSIESIIDRMNGH